MGFRDYRPPDRSKYLLGEEIARLLKAAAKIGAFEHRYLTFMANTGARPSESNELKTADLFAVENRIRVRTLKQKRDAAGVQKVVHRDVDLNPEYAKEVAAWSKAAKPVDLFFPRSRQALWSIFKRAAKDAGLSDSYTLYGLRHSRCIYLLEWTKDLPYTSQQMGHSSLDVTKVYLHCLPSKREDYVNTKLGRF